MSRIRIALWSITIALAVMAGSGMETALAQSSRVAKTKVTPIFPDLARRMRVSGTVKVELIVAPNGSIKSAKAIGGHPLLIDSAVSAAKQFKYEAGSEETKEIVEFKFNGIDQ